MKVRKGDNVVVIAGKSRGKQGAIVRAFPKKDLVLIDGINVMKRHQKTRRQGQKGQVVERPFPIHVSNVALVDSKGKAVRVGYKVEDGKKTRVSHKTGSKLG